MPRLIVVVAGLFLTNMAGFCQSSSTDAQVLQSLLAEIRQLRQDLQTVQRLNIAVSRWQAQSIVVALAKQDYNDAAAKLSSAQAAHKNSASSEKLIEDRSTAPGKEPEVRNALRERLLEIKLETEKLDSEERLQQTRATEAINQFQAEQQKLDELRQVLESLAKKQ